MQDLFCRWCCCTICFPWGVWLGRGKENTFLSACFLCWNLNALHFSGAAVSDAKTRSGAGCCNLIENQADLGWQRPQRGPIHKCNREKNAWKNGGLVVTSRRNSDLKELKWHNHLSCCAKSNKAFSKVGSLPRTLYFLFLPVAKNSEISRFAYILTICCVHNSQFLFLVLNSVTIENGKGWNSTIRVCFIFCTKTSSCRFHESNVFFPCFVNLVM